MTFKSNYFDVEHKKICNENYLHLINIEEIDSKLESLIDKSIVMICEGKTNTDLAIIKKRLIHFLKTKNRNCTEMGSIAEFFTHLYLNEIGFEQECLFFNLEEGSIKKGFDGYYSKANEEWIYESKSGSIKTENISHRGKIKEAYGDLKKTIAGKKKNNPWQNAYNHASHMDVASALGIRENLKKLSEDFIKGKYHDIKNFNVIPGSTIFLNGKWERLNSAELEKTIKKMIIKFKFKKIHIVCVNKKSLDLFWDYLNK